MYYSDNKEERDNPVTFLLAFFWDRLLDSHFAYSAACKEVYRLDRLTRSLMAVSVNEINSML